MQLESPSHCHCLSPQESSTDFLTNSRTISGSRSSEEIPRCPYLRENSEFSAVTNGGKPANTFTLLTRGLRETRRTAPVWPPLFGGGRRGSRGRASHPDRMVSSDHPATNMDLAAKLPSLLLCIVIVQINNDLIV